MKNILIIITLISFGCDEIEIYKKPHANLDIESYKERIDENDFDLRFYIGHPPNDHTGLINYYPTSTENVQFNHDYGCQLFLTSKRQEYNGRDYTSGSIMIDSLHYGKLTIIAKPPTDMNINAAIWLITTDCKEEIDICEHTDKPNEYLISLHGIGKTERYRIRNSNTFRGYYKYALERTPESLRFYINDVLILDKENEYHNYMNLVINNALYLPPEDDELVFKIDCIIFE